MKRSVKFVVSRATGIGEQTSAEIVVDSEHDMYEQLKPVYNAMDTRMWQKTLWMQSHIAKLRELPKEVQLGVIESIDYLNGQRTIPDYLLKKIEEDRHEVDVETPAETDALTEELRHG